MTPPISAPISPPARRALLLGALAALVTGCDRPAPPRPRASPAPAAPAAPIPDPTPIPSAPPASTSARPAVPPASRPASSAPPPPAIAGPASQARTPGDLVELTTLEPGLRLDIRYATAHNVAGRPLYAQARAFLVRPAALALVRAHARAAREGFGLTLFDAYRPWRVTKALWDATPPGRQRHYVANPRKGSRHNRGCAVDLTLHHLATGQAVEMPSAYDDFSDRAHRNYQGAPPEALAHRAALERFMTAEGFRGMSNEWWHFDFRGWEAFPILDVPFEMMASSLP